MTPADRDLSGKTSRGALLTLLGNLVVKGLSVVVIAVVAATLDAEAYGHAVLALAIYGFAEVMTSPALQTTLLREPDLHDQRIDVAWTVSVARGLLLAGLFYFAAPWLALPWSDAPAVTAGYLQCLALGFGLQGLANLHSIRLRRDLRFGRAFLVESAGPFLGTGLVIVGLTAFGEAIWIVLGPIVAALLTTVASWACVRPWPKFRLTTDDLSALWRFSRPLMLNAMMVFVLLNGDDLFVSSVAGFTALGIYAMSFRWSNTGVNFIVHGLHGVLTPAYVKMRADTERLQHAVIASLSVLTAACALVSVLFLAFADEFFGFLGGSSEWVLAAPVARALVPFVLSRGINASLAPVFIVLGKPHWLSVMTGVQLALFLPAMWLGHAWLGLPGIALGVASLSMANSVAHMYWLRQLLPIDGAMLIRTVLPGFLAAGLAASIGWLAGTAVPDPTWRLFLGGSITILSFLLLWELHCRRPLASGLPQRSLFAMASMLTR